MKKCQNTVKNPRVPKTEGGGGEERISSLEGITTNSLRTALLHRGDTL